MVSVCLSSDPFSQFLPSYLGFSYLGHGVSHHGCSSKAQLQLTSGTAQCPSNQCIEIEENNRMGKARDLVKKLRDAKGTFHAKMGLIKDRNGMDLQKQKILRRGGKNTQNNCTKKIFTTQIITML